MVAMRNPHLDDVAFAELWTSRLTSAAIDESLPAEQHLQSCADCRARYNGFASWLDTVRDDASAEAEEVFGAERLAAQQAHIIRRLEALEHPARVIAFPRFARPVSVYQDPRRRWVAAAAAAGLIVGVGLGQVLEFGRSGSVRQPETVTQRQIARGNLPAADAQRMAVQPIAQISDESLLTEQELTPYQVRVPESLQYLNAITPGVRDYDPQ